MPSDLWKRLFSKSKPQPEITQMPKPKEKELVAKEEQARLPHEFAIPVKVKRVSKTKPDLELPKYARQGDAGFDLRSDLGTQLVPGGCRAFPTGLAFEIPEGYELQIRPRSGLALKQGITILNAPGTIDSGYRGEVQVILINHSIQPQTIGRGDRIAQAVLARVSYADIVEVTELSTTERGAGGFGSTGTK
jgi:dUTP pyrophosphatase